MPQSEASIAAVGMLEKVVDELDGQARLVKIDTSRNQRIARRYGVDAMPALIIFNDCKPGKKLSGDFTAEDVDEQMHGQCFGHSSFQSRRIESELWHDDQELAFRARPAWQSLFWRKKAMMHPQALWKAIQVSCESCRERRFRKYDMASPWASPVLRSP